MADARMHLPTLTRLHDVHVLKAKGVTAPQHGLGVVGVVDVLQHHGEVHAPPGHHAADAQEAAQGHGLGP